MITLQDSPAEIISQVLLDASLMILPPGPGLWQSFINNLPDQPHDAVVVYDVGGVSDGRILATGERIEHPGLALRVRSDDYNQGWRKAAEIANFLDAIKRQGVTVGGGTGTGTGTGNDYVVLNVTRTSPILSIGYGEGEARQQSRRPLFVINAITTISPA